LQLQPLPEILYVGLRDRVDLCCVGKLERFDETKYFLRLFAMFFKNPPHVFHRQLAPFQTLLQQDKRPAPIPALLDLLELLFNFCFLVCRYRKAIMNSGRLHYDRAFLPIRARLAWQEIAIACKFKGRTQVQFGFGLFEFLWIIREIFGNYMVDMKAAHID
jgi:hypothetical protein